MNRSKRKNRNRHSANKVAPAAGRGAWLHDAYALAAIAALSLIVYGRCIGFDHLLYDDPQVLFQNPRVMTGLTWENVWWAFTNPNFGLYQPLPTISFMLDRTLFGDWVGGYHAVTLLWHLLCSCAFFLVTRRVFNSFPIAFAAALFFTVHPVQAMVVNWIIARNEIMAAFFVLLCVDAYCQYGRRRSYAAAAMSVGFMLLAMLSKQASVLLPLVLLLLDYWPLRRIEVSFRAPVATVRAAIPLMLEKLPWCVVAAAGVGFAFFGKTDLFYVLERNTLLTPVQNMGGALIAYTRYIFHFVYPVRYLFYYPASTVTITVAAALAAAALLVGITVGALALHKRRPYLAVGWGWFVLFMLPVSGLVEFAREAIALRYMYLPVAGLCLIIAYALYDKTTGAAASNAQETAAPKPSARNGQAPTPPAFWGYVAAIAFVWAVLCFWQSGFWRNSETLAARALVVTNNGNAMAHNHIATYREQQGRYEEMYEHHRAAAMLEPDVAFFQVNYAAALIQQQRFEEARQRLEPFVEERAHSAAFLSHYGASLLGVGRFDEARAHLEQALEIRPDYAPALYNMGLCLSLEGLPDLARPWLDRALKAQPNNAQLRELLESLDKR